MKEENTNEISLHALIFGHLKAETHDIRPFTIYQDNKNNIISRPFETFSEWSTIEQTSYIESIFLRCSLEPIVRFICNDHTILVDGYHRYNAILNFCNNDLKLNDKGLKKLKFLTGKNFEKLTEEEKAFFKKSEPINFIDYYYRNGNKIITLEEELEITRYLHILYNTGLKLEKEELQKAQFSDDLITNKIREKINNEEDNFLSILENLKQFNGRKQKNKIDNILLNCRLLIASTYSNIYNFSHTQNIQTRMDENYYPNINNLDKNKLFQDFELNILLIYNRLIATQKWEKYKNIQTKPFIDATYWLISVIRKDNLENPENFDFMKYLEYFANSEEKFHCFDAYQSHYQQNIYNKYYAVAKYYESISGHSLKDYFLESEQKKIFGILNNIEELYKKHFSYTSNRQKVSTIFEEIKENCYNIRPYYQRTECMNISLSSKIIESILLNITIPNILVYNNYHNERPITEVVDGQQRLLSLIGFFDKCFYNENKEMEYSNKTNYALKDLRILYKLNDFKIKTNDSKKQLPQDLQNKIMDYELTITSIDDSNNNGFSAVEHFIRLNKNSTTIKENTYRMWTLIGDIKILEYEKNITSKYINYILPPINSKRTANMITFKLASLFYHQEIKNLKPNDYSNSKVTMRLKEFNKRKENFIFTNPEKITILRNQFFISLDEVKNFYDKIKILLEQENKSIKELLETKKYRNTKQLDYYYLFLLLNSVAKENIVNNSHNIYNLVNKFFNNLNTKKSNKEEINNLLNYQKQILTIYSS